MATDCFQGFLSVLQFYSHLIDIKYGLHFSNQVKINMLFNKELIYLNLYIYIYIYMYIYNGIFRPKCGCNLIHKCGPQDLMVTKVTPLRCSCKCLSEWSLLSHKWKFFRTILDNWKSFKNEEKCFLFLLKSSFRSQDI